MSQAWGQVTSADDNPVLAALGLVHEQLNPMLLAEGYTQDEADHILARISSDLMRAVRSATHDQGEVAREFALRCIAEYPNGHLTQ